MGGPRLQASLSGAQEKALERGVFFLTKMSTANLFAKITMVLAAGVRRPVAAGAGAEERAPATWVAQTYVLQTMLLCYGGTACMDVSSVLRSVCHLSHPPPTIPPPPQVPFIFFFGTLYHWITQAPLQVGENGVVPKFYLHTCSSSFVALRVQTPWLCWLCPLP